MRPTSRVRSAASSTWASSARRSRRSGPTINDRSSLNASSSADPLAAGAAGASTVWPGTSSRPREVSAIPDVLGAGDPELVGESHGHFGQQGRNRSAVRLVRAEFICRARQGGEDLLDPLLEVVAQALVLLEHLLTDLALPFGMLFVNARGTTLQ